MAHTVGRTHPSPKLNPSSIIINVCVLFLSFQIFDFSLTEDEMKDIEALNKNVRFVEMLM